MYKIEFVYALIKEEWEDIVIILSKEDAIEMLYILGLETHNEVPS
jgi:hypothetical protein